MQRVQTGQVVSSLFLHLLDLPAHYRIPQADSQPVLEVFHLCFEGQQSFQHLQQQHSLSSERHQFSLQFLLDYCLSPRIVALQI